MKRYGLESRNWPTFLLKIPGALSPANGRQRTNIEVSEKYFPPSFTFTLARRNGYKLFFFVTLYSWFKEHARYANLSSQRKNTRGTPIYPPSGRTRAVRQFILPAEEHARYANLSSQRKKATLAFLLNYCITQHGTKQFYKTYVLFDQLLPISNGLDLFHDPNQ